MTQQIYTTPTPFSGTNISIPNSGKGYTSNMVIKGQTYQNIVNNFSEGWGHTNGFTIVSPTKIHAQTDGTSPISFTTNKESLPLLKPNTLYTVIALISNNTLNGNFKLIHSYEDVMLTKNSVTVEKNFNGLKIDTFTTIDNLNSPTADRLEINIYTGVAGEVTIENLIILEGDWTNKEVPSSIDGIESIGDKEGNKISILSNGKNLFNKNNLIKTTENNTPNRASTGLIQTKPNSVYYLKIYEDIKADTYNTRAWNKIRFYNKEKQYLNTGYNSSDLEKTITIQSNAYYFEIVFDAKISDVQKVQIMLSSIPIKDYEPFKEDKKEILLPIEGGLKSLPNGVADTIEQREDGVYLVQKVGKVILDGSQDESFTPPRQYGTAYRYDFNIDNMKLQNTGVLLCDTLKIGIISTNDLQCVNLHSTSTLLQIQVLNVNTIDAFREWLQANPVTVYYQLATPVETRLDIDNINLQTFKDLTYVISDNSIEPILGFKAPILGYKTINPIQLKTTQDGTEVNVYPYSTPELITFGDNETLADKMNNIENTHTHNNATVTTDGFMSKESYSKLESLTNYTHPSTHAATMITEDSTHRFITDTERNNWNAKASTNIATPSTNGLMSNTDKQKIDRISNNFDIVYDANTETIRFRFR